VGQEAVFTVDAFAGREFQGRVLQIRKAPRVVQNVVAYTVLISADNSDLKLLPGMTATIRVIVEERPNALKVPNAALRFKPNGEQESASPLRGRVYVAGEKGQPQPVDLVLGIGDGTFTEVVSGALDAGQRVVTGVNPPGSKTPGRAAKRFAF